MTHAVMMETETRPGEAVGDDARSMKRRIRTATMAQSFMSGFGGAKRESEMKVRHRQTRRAAKRVNLHDHLDLTTLKQLRGYFYRPKEGAEKPQQQQQPEAAADADGADDVAESLDFEDYCASAQRGCMRTKRRPPGRAQVGAHASRSRATASGPAGVTAELGSACDRTHGEV